MSKWHIIFLLMGGGIAFLFYDGFLSWRLKSKEQLREYLRRSDWKFYRHSLLELQRRGEDIKDDVLLILKLLVSDSRFEREGGWMILREIYADLAAQIPDYNPKDTVNVCKQRLCCIKLAS